MTKTERDKICSALLNLMFEVQEITEAVNLDKWLDERQENSVPVKEVFKRIEVE